jgi:membrane protein DedA with SNARE-associated domain
MLHHVLQLLHDYLQQLADWYNHSLDHGGYALIILLMIMESSVVPIPSEVIIPPAVFLALQNGRLNIPGIVIASVIGSWIGASIMYWVARWAGRPLVLRYGRFFWISEQKISASENWAQHYGSFGIFFSRVLPVVRHLIGIPAGIVRMNFGLYTLYTLLGSALWCCVLAWLSVKAHADEALMRGEIHRVTIWLVGAFVVLGGIYYAFVYRQMKKAAAMGKV